MSVSIGGGGAAAAGLNAASFAPAGFQEATDTYRKLQQELGGHVQKQAQFQAQHNENTLVKDVSIAAVAVRRAACWEVPVEPPLLWIVPQLNRPCRLSLNSQELDSLKDGESVYKLVGKVLVRQEASEAKATVNGRLEFIGKEL